MRVNQLHRWDLEREAAVRLQHELADKVVETDGPQRLRRVAAADVSYDRDHDLTVAGVGLFYYPDLEPCEHHIRHGRIPFPYVPGLLSFREVPLLVECFLELRQRPDVVLMDGHGRAHPRRFGLACHMGLMLDVPTIGCAKRRLVGHHDEPENLRGAWAPLVDDGELIGVALRSRTRTSPIYVSIGHQIDLSRAIDIVMSCCRRAKHPEPLRWIDRRVARRRRQILAPGGPQ